uniref:ECT2 PH domain-containing protein n=2 Tax=Amphimedon queenslandica TaxID=400682 RepID=A0A1X7TRR5_AMPQE
HLEFLTYSNIRSVIDFTDSEDVVNGFGLLVHWSDDPQERLLTFKINGDSSIKTELINKISQMMCTSNCAPSPDMFVWKTSSDILHSMPKTGGSIGPIDTGTIKRAFTNEKESEENYSISNRSNRRPFTPLSKNVDQLDTMDESFTDLDSTLNTCTLSVAPPFPPTPMRGPPTKRQALGYGHSFSSMDLTKLGSTGTL